MHSFSWLSNIPSSQIKYTLKQVKNLSLNQQSTKTYHFQSKEVKIYLPFNYQNQNSKMTCCCHLKYTSLELSNMSYFYCPCICNECVYILSGFLGTYRQIWRYSFISTHLYTKDIFLYKPFFSLLILLLSVYLGDWFHSLSLFHRCIIVHCMNLLWFILSGLSWWTLMLFLFFCQV